MQYSLSALLLLLLLLDVSSAQWVLLPKVMTKLSTLSAAGTIMLKTKQLAARQRLRHAKTSQYVTKHVAYCLKFEAAGTVLQMAGSGLGVVLLLAL
jgi:hypothetical protein